MGTSSRLYDEVCISDRWPALALAKAFADQVEAQNEASQLSSFDPEHMETLNATMPEPGAPLPDDWLDIFEKVKAYLFVGLVDPDLHHAASALIFRFLMNPNE